MGTVPTVAQAVNPGPQVPAAVVDKWNATGAAGRPENAELPGVFSIDHASLERMQTRPQSSPTSTAAKRLSVANSFNKTHHPTAGNAPVRIQASIPAVDELDLRRRSCVQNRKALTHPQDLHRTKSHERPFSSPPLRHSNALYPFILSPVSDGYRIATTPNPFRCVWRICFGRRDALLPSIPMSAARHSSRSLSSWPA